MDPSNIHDAQELGWQQIAAARRQCETVRVAPATIPRP